MNCRPVFWYIPILTIDLLALSKTSANAVAILISTGNLFSYLVNADITSLMYLFALEAPLSMSLQNFIQSL